MVDPLESGAENVLHPKVVLFSSIKTLPDYLNPRVVHQKYIVERLSIKQIAELTGTSKDAVLNSLRRNNIPLRASHQPHGRPSNPPYGFHLVAGRLAEHKKEQRTIQLIKKLYLRKELSLTGMARKLTEDGVPTKKGKGPWHHEMLRSILKREKLI